MAVQLFAKLAFCFSCVSAATLLPRQNSGNTAIVDLSAKRGAPQHLASGFIYGIPDAGFGQSATQIPASFYRNIGFNYARAGGAQMAAGGWIMGKSAYYARFNSTKSNYLTARSVGAKFQILPHDVWGTDHANSSTHWPGDNGDWTDYDNFLNQLLGDLKANNMITAMDWDLWNEADGGFWARNQTQYLAMWLRTYKRIRSDTALNSMKIVGPSSASQPSVNNGWWTTFIQFVVQNSVVPDQYTWHDEPGDVAVDMANLATLLSQYNAPTKPVNINEYATFDQQNSAGAAWWISRLERYNVFGLRGNWLSGCQLHDFMASLLGKTTVSSCTSAGYYPNGEYQVYQYYNLNMTGTRATTTGSGDGILDVYTTIGTSTVRTLTGVLNHVGTWYITINNLSAVGLPTSGSLSIQTWGFADNGHYGSESLSNRGIYAHTYSGNSVTFPVFQTNVDEYTAWGFEFAVGT